MKNIWRFTGAGPLVFLLLVPALTGAAAIQKTIDADGVTQMVIFESDFNQMLQATAEGQLKDFVRNASVKIYDGYFEVTAITRKPMTATLFIRATVSAADNKLYPKFIKIRYGFMPIPSFLVNFLISKIAKQDYKNFQTAGVAIPGVEWRSIEFKEGKAMAKFKEVGKN